MTAPATVGNFAQYVGVAATYEDFIVDSAGEPQDVTGWTATMTIHAAGDPGTVFLTVAGSILGVPTDGVFEFAVSPSDTSSMKPDQYSFVIERDDGSGTPPANAAVPTLGLFSLLLGSTFAT